MDTSLKRCHAESKGISKYTLDVNRYYNTTPRRIEQGIVGGNDVSIYKGNLVDLDSELRGITRMATKCPTGLYQPRTLIQNKAVLNCKSVETCSQERNKQLTHLPSSNIIHYKPKQAAQGYSLSDYRTPVSTSTSVKPHNLACTSNFAKF
jgi:hypothetical protein